MGISGLSSLEHIHVSERAFDLDLSKCVYREDLLERGLSDHAPVVARVSLRRR